MSHPLQHVLVQSVPRHVNVVRAINSNVFVRTVFFQINIDEPILRQIKFGEIWLDDEIKCMFQVVKPIDKSKCSINAMVGRDGDRVWVTEIRGLTTNI